MEVLTDDADRPNSPADPRAVGHPSQLLFPGDNRRGPRTGTAQELRLECMFPDDEDTEQAYTAFIERPLPNNS